MKALSDTAVLLEKIEFLETKIAFQDDTIESLNQSIIELNMALNAVRNDLILLADKTLGSNQDSNDPTQIEIPPHY